jgi:hypothetical protein
MPIRQNADDRSARVARMTITIGIIVGSILGAYLPVWLFHVSAFSALSLLMGFVGAAAGAWLGWKLTQWIEE